MVGLKKWFLTACQSVWTIGFVEETIDDVISGKPYHVQWLKVPTDCWYADPFVLKVTDEIIELLVEEWSYEEGKGSITKLKIDKAANKIIDRKNILRLDTHLSFPAVYQTDDGVFICPENSKSKSLNVYKYDEQRESVTFYKCISKLPLDDAVMTDLLGERLLFATHGVNANGNVLDVYIWNPENDIFDKYSSVLFNENIARMAGHFFSHNGQIFRPAQVCNNSYGQAVSLQVVEKKDGIITMKEIRRLISTHKHLSNGMHTFNYSQGVIVVDAWGWKTPILRKLFVDDWGNMKSWIKWINNVFNK